MRKREKPIQKERERRERERERVVLSRREERKKSEFMENFVQLGSMAPINKHLWSNRAKICKEIHDT
jgi:hypothetical protein